MASNPGERIPQTDDPRASSAGHLCIEWCNEENAKSFRLPVHYLAKPLYEIEVLCSNEDYYKLQYMFHNEKMQKTLAEFLTETKYRIQKTDQQLVISIGENLDKDSKTVSGKIEGILTMVKDSIKIVFAGKKSDDLQMENTFERLSEKCKKGNISVFPDKEGVWLVAEKEEELKEFCRTIANEYFDCEEVLPNLQQGHVNPKARAKRRGKVEHQESKISEAALGHLNIPFADGQMEKESSGKTSIPKSATDHDNSSSEDPGQVENVLEYKNDLQKGRCTDMAIEKGAKSKLGLDYAVNLRFLSNIEEKMRILPVSSSECAKYRHICKKSPQFLRLMEKSPAKVEAEYAEKDCSLKIQFTCLLELEEKPLFQDWVQNCLDIITECFDDTMSVIVEVQKGNLKEVKELIKSDDTVKRKEVQVTDAKNTSGFCLLGHGEAVFDIIDKLFQKFEQMPLIDPETNQKLCIAVVSMGKNFLRIAKVFRAIKFELPIDKIPNIKAYYKEEEVKLIGNAIDMKDAMKATKSMQWLQILAKKDIQFKEEVMSFLLRPGVEAYIDEAIAKEELGSWLVFILEKGDKKFVRLYSLTEDSLAQLEGCFMSSLGKRKILISNTDKFATLLSSWRSTAKQLEKDTGGKFMMTEQQKTADSTLELSLRFTADLSSNKSLQDFIEEIRAEVLKETEEESVEENETDEIDLDPMLYRYICKYKCKQVEEVANSEKLDLHFQDAGNKIVVKGSNCGIDFLKQYMKNFPWSRKCIIIPESIVKLATESFCGRYECLAEIHPFPCKSKIQCFGEGRVIMVCCSETIDNLHIDITLNVTTVLQGWGFQDFNLAQFEGNHIRVDVQIPEYCDEGKEQHKVHEVFQAIFTKMVQTKKRSLHIPMQNIGNWQPRKLVKCVLYSLGKLSQENSTFQIMFSDKDQERCDKMIYALNEPVNKTSQREKSVEFNVERGEIAKADADVIVNTTSTDFNLSLGAVSSSIMKEARGNIQLDLKGKKAKHGEILVTDSYRLQCKKVFHGALKSWTTNPKEEEECLKVLGQFVMNCLNKASEFRYTSIAFPAIGTGRIGIPSEEVVKHVRDAIQTFMDENSQSSLTKITFLIYKDEETFKTFEKLKGRMNTGTATDKWDQEEAKNLVLWGEAKMIEKAAEDLENDFVEEVKKRCSMMAVVKDFPEEPTSPEILDRGGPAQSHELEKSMKEIYKMPSAHSVVKQDESEKCCVIVTFKSPVTKVQLEELPILRKIKPRTILFPYTEKNDAMIVFQTPTDAEQAFLHVKDFGVDADLSYLAKQAVSNIQAYLSEKFLDLFDDKEKLCQGVVSRSGVEVQKKKNGNWILSGCLIQIDLAHKFLKEKYNKKLRGAKLEASGAESVTFKSASNLQKKKTESPLQNDDAEEQNRTFNSKEPQRKADMIKADKKVSKDVKDENKRPSLKQQKNILERTIPMSESKYLKFLRVFPNFQTQSGHDDEFMTYEGNKLVLRGSSSFLKDVISQIEMMETEMTEKSVVFEKQEEYHAALQDLKTKSKGQLDFYFHHDDANMKLTLFDFSGENVEKGLIAVKEFQKPNPKHVKEEKNEEVLTFTTNSLKVKLYTGSIIGLNVDCIVSSATSHLENKSGIAKAIADKAGREYQEDCANCVSKLPGGYLKEGQCCVTCAGKLSYSHVIHVLVGPVWGSRSSVMDAQRVLKQAVISVLIKADELQIKSVAIPAISAGQKYADKQVCADVYAKTVRDFSESARERKCLEEVHFVDTNEDMVNTIAQTFQKVIESKKGAASQQKVHGAEGGHTPQRPLPFKRKFERLKLESSNKSFVDQFQLDIHFTVKVYEGDILHGNVDAICSGQDFSFKSNGYIARGILKKWPEVKSYINAIDKRRINMEDVFNCECNDGKKILFVVTQTLTQQNSKDPRVLESIGACMKKLLCAAEENKIRKLALPLLGTGNKGAPRGKVISIWFNSIISFLKESSKGKADGLREVHFISKESTDIGEISSLFQSYIDNYPALGEIYV